MQIVRIADTILVAVLIHSMVPAIFSFNLPCRVYQKVLYWVRGREYEYMEEVRGREFMERVAGWS